jgi:hypothetical protein
MPQVQRGTAWDVCLNDYAYTREFDLTGWAWEFLRRNETYCCDYRTNRAGHPVVIKHVSGALLYRPRRKFLAAEAWGLSLFANPDNSTLEMDVFWQPELLSHAAHCQCKPANDNAAERLSLSSFHGRRAVLAGFEGEQVIFTGLRKSANLVVSSGTMLFGDCKVIFFHEGLGTASRHDKTMQVVKYFKSDCTQSAAKLPCPDSKYLHYLIALDGHLAGRSYREIAQVLYGNDSVGAYWTDDTRGLKSKVRRAVEQGLSLMNGGYRALL